MKRFYFLATLILGLVLPSCNNASEGPYPDNSMVQIVFEIIVTDKDGNIIVQQENGEETIKGLLSVEYHGYTATVKKAGEPSNGQLHPYISYFDNKPVSVRFGFFPPELNYKDETFTLIWSDGARDVVKFSTYVAKDKDIYNYSATINGSPLTWEDSFTPVIRKTIDKPNK